MESIVIWKNRANTAFIQLRKTGVALTSGEMDLITKVEFHYKEVYYSSTNYPDSFDLETYKAEGKIAVKLGLLPIAAGSDVAELIIYDVSNTSGIMWMQLATQVRSDAL